MKNEVIDILEKSVKSPDFYIGKDYGGSAYNWPHNKIMREGINSVLFSTHDITKNTFRLDWPDPLFLPVDNDKMWDLKCDTIEFKNLKYIDIYFDDDYGSIHIKPHIVTKELHSFTIDTYRVISKFFGLSKKTEYKKLEVDEFKYTLEYNIKMGNTTTIISKELAEELYDLVVDNRNDLVVTTDILAKRIEKLK